MKEGILMGQIKNNFDNVMKYPDVSRACKKLPNSALDLIYSFGRSENFETMVGMPDIFINLIRYINRNTEIFDVNTYYGDIEIIDTNNSKVAYLAKSIGGVGPMTIAALAYNILKSYYLTQEDTENKAF